MQDSDRICGRCGARYGADVIFCPKDGTPITGKKTEVLDDPYLGLRLAEQFELQQLIGIGAMGRVYRAHQRGVERAVAVKILHRDLLRNPTMVGRFLREARVASRLSHPNVVQVLSTGEIPKLGADVGGEAYLAMEYLDGISLRSALAAAGGAMPLPRALHVVLQICDAVGEAHAQGIVHRDLKPENVMLVRRGDDPDYVKVLDFGVARIQEIDASIATQAGVIFGTARYISPEGAQGKPVGAPSDVYSISVVLYQCLSGRAPFEAESPVAILVKHTNEPAPDVRTIPRSSYVPEPLARLLAANLAKDPAERCRDARELGRALMDAARAGGLSPDELVVRSTLATGAPHALTLASMQRTKSLALSEGLAARLAGGTVSLDAPAEDRPAAPSARPSTVEPTLSDDTAPRPSVPSNPAILPSEPPSRAPSVPAPSRPSSIPPSSPYSSRSSTPFESSDSLPPPLPTAPRWPIVMLCFVLGAIIALFVAFKLDVFAPTEPPLASYVARAEAATRAEAWDDPPRENVRDITDTALRRWPGAPRILEARRSASRALVDKARALSEIDAEKARRYATLAAELDPKNEAARELCTELGAPPPALGPAPEPAPSSSVPAIERPPVTPIAPRPLPSAEPAPSAPSLPASNAPAPAAPSAGRWL